MATILCIDDNRNILEIHRALLESKGYRVVTAIDGPTGIALSRLQSIDVVVLDCNMPGMDGNEVRQQIPVHQTRNAALSMTDFGSCGYLRI